MVSSQEKRFNDRAEATAPIVYFPFTSLSSYKCRATVLNASEYGLCFRSPRPLKPGQCICIHTRRFVKEAVGLRNFSLAQVRWCAENEDGRQVDFNIGVSFVEPQPTAAIP